jgi:hypothetical protein
MGLRRRVFRYRYVPNHRISLSVLLKYRLRALAHEVADLATHPLPHDDSFCFVAGCGHSGTTLLASKLGLHPDVLLISRETHAFLPHNSLQLASVILEEWLTFARQEHRAVIVEKSPKHIHVLGRIRRLLPGSRCIVMVRNPLDTCASLYERVGDLDLAIERWLMDNEAAIVALQLPSTLLVRYETLTREPEATLSGACSFLGIPWDPGLLTRTGSAYSTHHGLGRTMTLRQEQVSQPIRDNNGRWVEVLDARMAETVRERTAALARRLGYAS